MVTRNRNIYGKKKRCLKEIVRHKKASQGIPRNSYEFCENNYKCSNQSKCNKKHFVYNYVASDIIELIVFLYDCKEQRRQLDIKEVVTSISTITYVFSHMYKERDMLNELNKI